MKIVLGDIETRADCEALVRAFYERAIPDPIIGFFFTDVAHMDLEAHIPVITSFWETMLLDAHTYGGGAFGVHAALDRKAPFEPGHFARWLVLWRQSVDERFEGERAELAKRHAERVARAFLHRLQGLRPPAQLAPELALSVTRHGGA